MANDDVPDYVLPSDEDWDAEKVSHVVSLMGSIHRRRREGLGAAAFAIGMLVGHFIGDSLFLLVPAAVTVCVLGIVWAALPTAMLSQEVTVDAE